MQPVANSTVPLQKPGMVVAISIMTIADGAINLVAGLGGICSLLFGMLATFGLSILCVPIFIYPLVLGILELIYGIKMASNPPTITQPLKWLAIMEIINIVILSVNSLVVGILALVFYNDAKVVAFYAQLNGATFSPHPTRGQQA